MYQLSLTFFFLFGPAESGIRGSQDEERLVKLSERNTEGLVMIF